MCNILHPGPLNKKAAVVTYNINSIFLVENGQFDCGRYSVSELSVKTPIVLQSWSLYSRSHWAIKGRRRCHVRESHVAVLCKDTQYVLTKNYSTFKKLLLLESLLLVSRPSAFLFRGRMLEDKIEFKNITVTQS